MNLNEIERSQSEKDGAVARQSEAQVFLKENNCEMEMEKSGPRDPRSDQRWCTMLDHAGPFRSPLIPSVLFRLKQMQM